MADQIILACDTSGPYCGTTILRGGDVIAARHVEMQKGQAEALMPLIEETLHEAGLAYGDLTRLAVGTGPGNFTGIRISVAAMRGLALSLGIPAIGVTLFDALSVGAPRPFLACLQATKNELYVSEIHADWRSDPVQRKLDEIDAPTAPECICIGHRSDEVAAHLGLTAQPAAYAPASAIARFAAGVTPAPGARPAPYYLRAPDAAPPRDPAPVILP
jgi:tRNA threonylcarbamoyl adenosine modification protein YeaZ